MDEQLPSQNDSLHYLEDEILARIKNFNQSAKWYRRRYYATTMSAILLSGAITVIAGWRPNPHGNWPSNLILALGAASTVIAAWGAFFSPRETWLLYAQTLNKLKSLRAQIEYTVRSPVSIPDAKPRIDTFFARYQAIVDEHNKQWLDIRSSSTRNARQEFPKHDGATSPGRG